MRDMMIIIHFMAPEKYSSAPLVLGGMDLNMQATGYAAGADAVRINMCSYYTTKDIFCNINIILLRELTKAKPCVNIT